MKYAFSIICFAALLGAAPALAKDTPAEPVLAAAPVAPFDIEHLGEEVALPALDKPLGLNVSSEDGKYQYEALEKGAEKPRTPEPIAAKHMAGRKPMIAILIDDMGLDHLHGARAVKLPAAVTLAYLPYSPNIKDQAAAARKAGHELIVHMPMQPERKTADPGPDYLGDDVPPLLLLARVQKSLLAFDGYVGVNNHMGSKFTKNADALAVVMSALAEKKVFFLDSLTDPGSVAEKVARAHNLQTSHRDVFLDDDISPAAVAKSLAQAEAIARQTGTAIAIGHPKEATLAALEQWLPTLAGKGFELVKLSEVIDLRSPKLPDPPAATLVAEAPKNLSPAELETPAPAGRAAREAVAKAALARPGIDQWLR
ncbi:MAG TPA: divergent polysaccharide deacetylase family protein [Patescibacteria group bacterium]|nr:divergent polysaccharide deacetylase family protein [Patescibacteria group bacterium]